MATIPPITVDVLVRLTAEFDKPMASKMLVGSTSAMNALRRAFPPAESPLPSWFGIPVTVDPTVGFDNIEVRDQYGNVMTTLKVLNNYQSWWARNPIHGPTVHPGQDCIP